MTPLPFAFEIRDGETLELCEMESAPFAFGLFPIPTPGPMVDCGDKHGGPCEAYKLTLAQRRGDRWMWICPGSSTHHQLAEILFDAPRGVWHGFKLTKLEPQVAVVMFQPPAPPSTASPASPDSDS